MEKARNYSLKVLQRSVKRQLPGRQAFRRSTGSMLNVQSSGVAASATSTSRPPPSSSALMPSKSPLANPPDDSEQAERKSRRPIRSSARDIELEEDEEIIIEDAGDHAGRRFEENDMEEASCALNTYETIAASNPSVQCRKRFNGKEVRCMLKRSNSRGRRRSWSGWRLRLAQQQLQQQQQQQ
eukprot:scpid94877/ scgid16171/ 